MCDVMANKVHRTFSQGLMHSNLAQICALKENIYIFSTSATLFSPKRGDFNTIAKS